MLRSSAVRSLRVAQKSVRTFATESDAAPKTEVVVKQGSTFFQRLTSFTVGFGVAAGVGLYQLQQDVDQSTKEIQQSVASLKNEVIAQNAALTKRIQTLEAAAKKQ